MGSDAIITYKRRRTLLKSTDRPHFPSESSVSRKPNNLSKQEEKPLEDINNASSLSAQATTSTEVMRVDNRSPSPLTGAKDTPSTSIPSKAPRDFDCNLLPEYDSDENAVPGQPDSTDKRENELQRIGSGCEVRAIVDKGKGLLDPEPLPDKAKGLLDTLQAATGTSSGNKSLQLFRENRTSETLRLPSNSHKMLTTDMLKLGSSSLQPKSNNGPTHYAPVYGWPNLHVPVQQGEAFQDMQQCNTTSDRAPLLSRQKSMLDNILDRARSTRGGRSTDFPTTWLDEELDSLWVGVRRHGRGNWQNILQDRRLTFLPWKTPRDLATKWEEEQARIFYSNIMPLYQVQPQATPQASGKRLLENSMSVQSTGQVQTPATNFSPYMYWGPFHPPREANSFPRPEPSQNASSVKGNLPSSFKEAVGTPPGSSKSQPHTTILHPVVSRNKRSHGSLKKTEIKNGGKAPSANPPLVIGGERDVNQQDLIVISSDGSSEETVPNDRRV